MGRSKLRVLWRWTRASGLNLLIAFLLLAGLAGWALRTALGNETVVRGVISWLDQKVDGQIRFGEARSGNLLRGARLIDLVLITPAGDTLLRADSLEINYQVRELLRGRIAFSDVSIWGADLQVISDGTTDEPEPSTLARFLGPGPGTPAAQLGEPETAPTERSFVLTDLNVVDARIRIRLPTDAVEGPLVRTEAGDASRIMALDAVIHRLDIPNLEVLPAGRGGTTVEIRSVAGVFDVTGEPVEVLEGNTEIRISPELVLVDVRSLNTNLGRVSGTVTAGLGDSLDVQLSIRARELDMGRLQWISDRIPEFQGGVDLRGRIRESGSRWGFTNADLEYQGGRLTGNGAVELDDALTFDEIDLALAQLPTSLIDDYLPEESRLPGTLSGRLRLNGPQSRLSAIGRLTLRQEQRTTTADINGVIIQHENGPELRALRIGLDPLNFGQIAPLVPGMRLTGTGSAQLELTGSLDAGLRIDLDVRHTGFGGTSSHVVATGTARRGAVWTVDMQGSATPLSLSAIPHDYPDIPIEGLVSGTFRLSGPINDMNVVTDMEGDFGRAALTLRLNPARPGDGVVLAGTLTDFQAARFVPALKEPTLVSAEVEFDGRGSSLSTLAGEGRVRMAASRVSGVPVDSALLAGRIESSDLIIDSLRGRVAGFDFFGRGSMAVDSTRPAGEVRLNFSTESLGALRPLFMGDTVIARDTLRDLQREILIISGIDPDTLPLAADVAFDGRLLGEVVIRGSVADFEAEGHVTGRQVMVGRTYMESGVVDFHARGLPAREARVEYDIRADSTFFLARALTQSHLEGEFSWPSGHVVARLAREDREIYDIETDFTLQHGGFRADVAALELQIDSDSYRMVRPTMLSWTDSTRRVNSLEIVREGTDPVRIRADGVLPYRGPADFTLDVDQLEISRLLRVAQRTDLDIEGTVDLAIRVVGDAANPRIDGTFGAWDVRYGTVRFDSVNGDLDYQQRSAGFSLSAVREGLRVLTAGGSVPVNLALVAGVDRFPDEAMDVTVVTDRLPARTLIGWLEDLEDVEGTVTGDFRITGRVDNPEASGDLELQDGAWTMGSVGVRHSQANGTMRLLPGGRVEVDARAVSDGTVVVTGEIILTSLIDPEFDLDFVLENFRAVNRIDVAGNVSGDLKLTQRFRQPRLEGSLRVVGGTLYLDEFQRSIEVLDLTDPRFAAVIDTTELGGRPFLAQTTNPFLDALYVAIDLSVESNTWLRGEDLQVEITGEDLTLFYDRQRRDVTLLGEFQVVRGQGNYYRKGYEVNGGTVSFLGTSGINPNMDIQATARVRRQNGPPLDIDLQLGGTLLNPRFTLSSTEQGLSDSDLLSYLVFGQPSSSLTQSGLGSGGAREAVLGFAGSWLTGSLANQLASLASQELGMIDYLSISQVGDAGAGTGSFSSAGFGASFANTQVEIGRYFSNGEIFGALILRPLSGLGTSGRSVGGARMEWQSSDNFHLEAFVEDRFLRSSGIGLAEIDGGYYIIGFSLVREWGY